MENQELFTCIIEDSNFEIIAGCPLSRWFQKNDILKLFINNDGNYKLTISRPTSNREPLVWDYMSTPCITHISEHFELITFEAMIGKCDMWCVEVIKQSKHPKDEVHPTKLHIIFSFKAVVPKNDKHCTLNHSSGSGGGYE
ncbi:hypothetical protein [Agarilytica rhodophyticola]|uniref:hypothetical protein n=1 Tax=Agarilytica rhodophyticola TaxID=1737490 RepID=UPI000B348437|nr:hypothetical protein [Agarilytica rhodophyticola]